MNEEQSQVELSTELFHVKEKLAEAMRTISNMELEQEIEQKQKAAMLSAFRFVFRYGWDSPKSFYQNIGNLLCVYGQLSREEYSRLIEENTRLLDEKFTEAARDHQTVADLNEVIGLLREQAERCTCK